MKYPRRNQYLTFEKIDDNKVKIKDFLTDKYWTASVVYAKFLKYLDGNNDPYKFDPYYDKNCIDNMLEQCEKNGLLFDGKRFSFSLLQTRLVLAFPQINRKHRIIGRIWNLILMVSFIPVFILGWANFASVDFWGSPYHLPYIVDFIIAYVLGLAVHELSHGFACIGYGGELYEGGVALMLFMPGAYVMIDFDKIKNKFKRVQILMAGVQSNLLLSGVSLLLAKFEFLDAELLAIIALINTLLAAFNIVPFMNFDGNRIFQEIIGIGDSPISTSISVIINSDIRRKLKMQGMKGRGRILVCYLVMLIQLAYPVIIIENLIATGLLLFDKI